MKALLKVYKRAAKANVSNITAMVEYGEALMKLGNYEKAGKAFKRAYKLDSTKSRVLENLHALVFHQNIDNANNKNDVKSLRNIRLPPPRL